MTTIRNIILAAGFSALGALAAVGGQAVAGAHGGGPFGPDLARLAQALDLSDAQAEMVDEMRTQARAQMRDSRMSKQADQEDIKTMLSQEVLDAAVVHSMIDDRINEMSSFAHEMADEFIALHATLDADQRATLVEKMAEAGERHEERRRRHIEHRSEDGEQ